MCIINRFSIIIQFLLFVNILISCSGNDEEIEDIGNSIDYEVEEDYETNSIDSTFTDAITIAFSANGVTIGNPYSATGVTIEETNGKVVVNSTFTDTEINYVLSGVTADGSLKIYSKQKFGLIFNGVSIINKNGPAINIQSDKKASVTLLKGTRNRLVDGSTYEEKTNEDQKGAFFSEGAFIFDGTGSLTVIGRYKHAICSDDYVEIKNGNITVEIASKDGIHVNDYFQMEGGALSIASLSDGIECEEGTILINGGTLAVNSTDDGIVSSYEGNDNSIDPSININGGTITISTAGEKGMGIKTNGNVVITKCDLLTIQVAGNGSKGIKTGNNVNISGGTTEMRVTGDAFFDKEDNEITSPAGVKCDGNFTLTGGTLTINSSGTGGKGINVDGTIKVDAGSIYVTTTGGQFRYGTDDTAAKAIKAEGEITIQGGKIIVKTSATEAEGIESKSTLTINGGEIEVEAYDDCLNASKHIAINGGSVYCYSQTNDGIDSNGTLTITGGVIISSGSTSPEEGLDNDNNTFKITGGTILGIGGSTSTPSSSVSTQRSVIYGGSGSADQIIRIQSESGTDILTYKIPRNYSQMTLLFSSNALQSGTTYTIYQGGSITGGTNFHGLYSNATYTGGTAAATFTPSSMVTSVGRTSTGIGGGGGPR
ncbi:carbohydrate-binding domain-containing protein [Parabacteroides sp. Marseille-P3160]|uniref:carbohydrate-binding domain-containing protein n=1 Tax=Parabacteroides sp. Marseille-P3160 TaxID=1917887 RepID=UPI0009B97AE5|nr:carbohydrate-binding domain-containing protein [Parabacteroides sp. Marseille-P3160]